jgi:hypothetical protein
LLQGQGQGEARSSIDAVRDDACARWGVRDMAALERLVARRFARLANELRRDTDLYAS